MRGSVGAAVEPDANSKESAAKPDSSHRRYQLGAISRRHTGKQKSMEAGGRVDRFKKRFGARSSGGAKSA